MSTFLSALRRGVGSVPVLRDVVRAALVVLRQWPWIRPAGIEPSAARWIDRAGERAGWYARQRGDWYRVLHASKVQAYAPPAEGAADGLFRNEFFRRLPEAGVYCLRGAYLLGDEGAVLSRDHRLFGEFVHHFGTARLEDGPYFRPFAAFRARIPRREEWIALLAAPQGRNHYHWLFDVLPRLHLLEEYRAQIERYAVPRGLSGAQREALARLGVREGQLLELDPGDKLYCERLLVPSLPGSEGAVAPWAAAFLRERLGGGTPPGPGRRRLFVSRSDARERRLSNEAEVAALLEARGFETITPGSLDLEAQIAAFREAGAVVACHGAALANLVFSPPCRVLEFLSPQYLRPDCYFTLSRLLGHEYRALVGEPSGPGWGDIRVDTARVAAVVESWT